MELQRDSLLKLVKATRAAMKVNEEMRNALRLSSESTALDDADGWLKDVLFDLSGEILRFDQDFMRDSKTMNLIRSELSDREVADELEWMHMMNKGVEENDPG